jgi:DHA2 family multidrug resistance protein
MTAANVARAPITLGLLLAVMMISTDATMVNVALPNMQGELSASAEQITWVLTSFIVAQGMMIPISGWLADRFGIKPMLLLATAAFTVVSVFCGAATSLPEMVLFRLLQGVTGACVAPLGQAVILNINPPERFGRAMALFVMASVAGPIVGPVLGGWITDQFSWRWCFYINIFVGAASLLLVWTFLPREPHRPRRFDFLGFASLATAIAGLQLMLDRGPSQDWFAAREVWVEAIVAACGLWVFVWHTATARHPLFKPGLFSNRNFVAATIITVFFSVFLFGSVALLPLLTQGVLGYTVWLSGLVGVPRAIVVVAILQVMGKLDTIFDRRLMIGFGLFMLALSFWQASQWNLDMTPMALVFVAMIQGVGHGFMSAPLTTVAVGGLRADLRPDGAAISNLIRTLGGSIGIAALQGLTLFNSQRMHASLAAHVRLDDPVVRSGLGAAYSPETLQGALRLNEEITRQAAMVAYANDFRLMAILTLCAAPLLLLIRNPKAVPAQPLPADTH